MGKEILMFGDLILKSKKKNASIKVLFLKKM